MNDQIPGNIDPKQIEHDLSHVSVDDIRAYAINLTDNEDPFGSYYGLDCYTPLRPTQQFLDFCDEQNIDVSFFNDSCQLQFVATTVERLQVVLRSPLMPRGWRFMEKP